MNKTALNRLPGCSGSTSKNPASGFLLPENPSELLTEVADALHSRLALLHVGKFDANKRKTYEGHQFAADLQTFGYDFENRVTSWTRDGVESQSWLLSTVGDWQSTTRNGVTQTRTHSDVHETTGITIGAVTTPLTYDKKGNLTQDELGQKLNWDVENRLITAVSGAATNGYFFDALGRRLGKRANGLVTTFVHSGAQVIAEYEAPASRGQITRFPQ